MEKVPRQNQKCHHDGRRQNNRIHEFPADARLAFWRQMTPAVAQGLSQPSAATNPGAVALTMEQHQHRNDAEGQNEPPHHPNLARVAKERIEKQRPRVDYPIGTPGLSGENRIVRQPLPYPLVLDRPAKQKLGYQEKEKPLEGDQAHIAPDLEAV